MIIKCQSCNSEFKIDESRLKEGGSKVRCAVCKDVFEVYPSEKEPVEDPSLEDILVEEEYEETVALDSVPDVEAEKPEAVEESIEAGFDKAFEDVMDEKEPPTASTAQMDMEGAIDKASRVEEEGLTWADTDKQIPKKRAEVGEAPDIVLPKGKPGRSVGLLVVLVVILLLLGGAVTIFFLAPHLIPDSLSFLKPSTREEVTDVGIAKLGFKAVTGSFIESKEAGQLFVVKGMVTNNYSNRRSFILVKAAILDEQGKVVKRKMAYAGNIFRDEQIKTLTVDEITKAAKNRFGKGRMNLNLEPNSSIPFLIIFADLPENMTEFTVEAVRSSPGE